MRKYVFTICELIFRAAYLAALAACWIVWRKTPATAFAVTVLGLGAFACYIVLGRVESSLSEEKRYDNLWRRDRSIPFTLVFIAFFAALVWTAVAIAPRIATPDPEREHEKERREIIAALTNSVLAVNVILKESSEDTTRLVKALCEKTGSAVTALEAAVAGIDKHATAVEHANSDVQLMGEGIISLRCEVSKLTDEVSRLGRQVGVLAEAIKKIPQK